MTHDDQVPTPPPSDTTTELPTAAAPDDNSHSPDLALESAATPPATDESIHLSDTELQAQPPTAEMPSAGEGSPFDDFFPHRPDEGRTTFVSAAEPTVEGVPSTGPVQESAAAAAPSPSEPIWIQGPAIGPIVIGVIGLVAVVWGWLTVATDLRVDWSIAGPASVIGIGVLIIGLGLLGLRRHRA